MGSSNSNRPGLDAIARAIATRLRCPPDRVDGIRSMNSARPTKARTSSTRRRAASERHVARFVEPVADVLGDGQRIEQRILLKQHADIGADAQQIGLAHVVDAVSVDEDHAAVGAEQSENQLEYHGLPRAARSKQNLHAARHDAEAHIAEDPWSSNARDTCLNSTADEVSIA